jgi:hypothetical protein
MNVRNVPPPGFRCSRIDGPMAQRREANLTTMAPRPSLQTLQRFRPRPDEAVPSDVGRRKACRPDRLPRDLCTTRSRSTLLVKSKPCG